MIKSDKKFTNSMEWLQYIAKEHSIQEDAQKRNITLQDHKKAMKESEVVKTIKDGKLWCSKCKRFV